jgi:hypothetical protein
MGLLPVNGPQGHLSLETSSTGFQLQENDGGAQCPLDSLRGWSQLMEQPRS